VTVTFAIGDATCGLPAKSVLVAANDNPLYLKSTKTISIHSLPLYEMLTREMIKIKIAADAMVT
jgi:hypothetical protein